MALVNLPGRSEHSAPSFDDSRSEELERYFTDLEDLFNLHAVNDEHERKQGALKYLKVQTESLWKTAEEWRDVTKSYNDFKQEVFKLYPGATSDRTYTIQELDLVIGHYARIGIISSADLGEYHRRFLLISRYLISKNQLATQEQSRSFFRAAHYVLMGTASALMAPIQGAMPTQPSPPQVADATQVKLETLTTALASLSETVKTILQTQQAGPRSVCNFCSVPGHFIRECEVVEEFTRFGKCKRSPEGKVVLPTGAMVPCSIPGAWMHDRIEEWHWQNPGQTAAQILVLQ
ncbi:hypothetical protein V8E52_011978 [Russula decolorans]